MVEHDLPGGPVPLRPVVYEPKTGELFAGRYRIERLLGRGAAGAVWAALDEAVGDRVALKLLGAGPDDAAERFRREVRLARRVTHRNAARIFDLGTLDGVLFLTMELIEGESLLELLSRLGRLGVAQTLDIGHQIALGLSAAHEVDVVHRDIKPANVLLESGGRVVLTDFGVARALVSDAQLTLGAVMIGTPSYMAPEQVRGESIGPAADLYALGAVLYESLTGRCPFVGDSVVATATSRLHNDPDDPRRYATLPEDLAALVLKLLERSPEQRPESAVGVAGALDEMARRWQGRGDQAGTLLASTPGTMPAQPLSPGGGSGVASTTARDAVRTFVSVAPEQRTLAVLPFRHRGASEHAYLAESLGEDLVDILTSTRGLRVTASGATAKYTGQMVDPRDAGRELGADAIVDGTVRVARERVLISARLVDVATGEQLWVGRFDGTVADAFELEETVSQRIAESLRLELELLNARHSVPKEAIDLLLQARQRFSTPNLDEDALGLALEMLDRALELAPDFGLAVATHAEYAVRRWFLPAQGSDEDVARIAHDSVARALAMAPDLPLTHYAAARLAVSDGRFGDAASELSVTLSMAPTFAAAHDYLGMLQCEAGRGEEGERHIRLARTIDPTIPLRAEAARRRALAGDLESYREMVKEMRAAPSTSRFMIESLEMRFAGWFGDLETVRRCHPSSFVPPDSDFYRLMEAQRAALLGEGTAAELQACLEAALRTVGPRLDAFIRQLAIEALVPLGDLEGGLEQLRILAAAPAFVDTDWMERCPALEALRPAAEFLALSAQVRRRADAIWRVFTS